MIQSFRGWSHTIVTLPAFHLSMIRKHIRSRNAVLLQGFLTEEAKMEYDELYEYLDNNYEKNTNIIMNDTTLSQIEECVSNIPVVFSRGTRKEY